jgi:hypothetical protein
MADNKKLFDLEYNLEHTRPEFTADETIKAMTQAQTDVDVSSFNILPGGVEGLYIKFAAENGTPTKTLYMNPVAAKALAQSILHNLSEQGFYDGALADDEYSSDTPRTIH